jgi:hypothetical protein
VAARSRPRDRDTFSRGRLFVGLILVCAIAAGAAFGLARFRGGPDPGRLVYATRQGVFSRELETGRDRRLAELPDDVEAAMPSPDGRYVAYATGQGELWLRGLDNEKRFQVAQRFTVPLGWSPDGRMIAGEIASDRDLVAVDPEGEREILLSGGYATGSLPVWIDEDRFAIGIDENSFAIVDGDEPSGPIDGHPLAASPDGAEIVVLRDDEVIVANVDGDELTDERPLLSEEASAAGVSPAGHLAIATHDGVRVFEGGTRSTEVVEGPVDWVGWANAGRILLYSRDGGAFARELPDGEEKRISRDGVDVLSLLALVVV